MTTTASGFPLSLVVVRFCGVGIYMPSLVVSAVGVSVACIRVSCMIPRSSVGVNTVCSVVAITSLVSP